jgi:hypothetical protein
VLTNALPPQQWTLFLAAGSAADVTFTFTTTAPGGVTPYPTVGFAWEYVVRETAGSSGSPLISVTTSPSSAGLITATATSAVSQILLALYPAATASLGAGSYSQALWSQPGTTNAFCWMSGTLTVSGAAQP